MGISLITDNRRIARTPRCLIPTQWHGILERGAGLMN